MQSMAQNWIKSKSIRKLSNLNFQCTKTLYQNNFNHIAFFFTLFKGFKCYKLYEITLKKNFPLEPEKNVTKWNLTHDDFTCVYLDSVLKQNYKKENLMESDEDCAWSSSWTQK